MPMLNPSHPGGPVLEDRSRQEITAALDFLFQGFWARNGGLFSEPIHPRQPAEALRRAEPGKLARAHGAVRMQAVHRGPVAGPESVFHGVPVFGRCVFGPFG